MISRGKRRYIQRLISTHLWKQLPPNEQERRMRVHIEKAMRSVACHYRVPIRVLYGLPVSEVEVV